MAVYFCNTKCYFYVNISNIYYFYISHIIKSIEIFTSSVEGNQRGVFFFKFIDKKIFTPTPLDKQIHYIVINNFMIIFFIFIYLFIFF